MPAHLYQEGFWSIIPMASVVLCELYCFWLFSRLRYWKNNQGEAPPRTSEQSLPMIALCCFSLTETVAETLRHAVQHYTLGEAGTVRCAGFFPKCCPYKSYSWAFGMKSWTWCPNQAQRGVSANTPSSLLKYVGSARDLELCFQLLYQCYAFDIHYKIK